MAEPRDDEIQTEGRRENAAQPLDAAKADPRGAERYPPSRPDEALEGEKSFEPRVRNETAPKDARFGKGVDPAEGKR